MKIIKGVVISNKKMQLARQDIHDLLLSNEHTPKFNEIFYR